MLSLYAEKTPASVRSIPKTTGYQRAAVTGIVLAEVF